MSIFTIKIKALIPLVILFCSFVYPQSGFDWSTKGSGKFRNFIYGLTVDVNGNIYAAGELFSDTLTFPPDTKFTIADATGTGNCDLFITKFDPSGSAVWGFQAGGTLTDRSYGVAADQNGNLFATGHYFGQTKFGSITVNSSGNLDIFTAKFSNSGDLLWVKEGKSAAQASTRDITVDANGNFYIVGYYGSATIDSVRFDNVKIVTNGQRDIFLVKYNNDGVPQWGKTAGGLQGGEQGNAVAVDLSGNVFMTGVYTDTASFDDANLYGIGVEIFLAKYSPNGDLLWAKSAGGPKADNAYGITVDPSGNVYISGGIDSVATFETTTIFTAGGVDAFLAKYDASGNLLWVKTGGGTANDALNDIVSDKYGNILGTGYFNGTATFGETVINGFAGDDVFFVKYDSNGNILGLKEASGPDNDRGTTVAVDADGNMIAGGYLTAGLKIGADSLVSLGKEDIFITKILEAALPVELVSFNASIINNSVKLTWSTATEINNSGFQIERKSKDIWENIGFVNGRGSVSEKSNYTFIDKDVLPLKYIYRLKQIDYDGTYTYSKEIEIDVEIPATFELDQNFPNPFNPATTINFSLPVEAYVTLSIFNSLGEEAEVIVSNSLEAGKHSVNINAQNYSSGVYVYVIKAVDNTGRSFISSRKMIVLK